MVLDLVVIGALSFAALVGALSGALAQGTRLLAVAAAGLLSRPAGAWLGTHLEDTSGLPPSVIGPVSTSAAFVCLYLLLHFTGRALVRNFTRDRELRALDRCAGAFFGALQAGVILWIALSVLVGLEGRIGLRLGGEGSLAATVVRKHDFFSAIRSDGSPGDSTGTREAVKAR